MRSPAAWGTIYLVVGLIFIYFAAVSPENMWSFHSLLMMVLAAYNIYTAIKLFAFASKIKKAKK
jgi:cobalamin biosynthesis protein CobD/CbiB